MNALTLPNPLKQQQGKFWEFDYCPQGWAALRGFTNKP
jgi:hypothetical protein